MKKLALTSLLAVFAISGAHAANVIDGNPLYMPRAGHFYSVSSLSSHSENADSWALGEEFGYGVSDRLAINVRSSISEDEGFDAMGWDEMDFGAAFRLIDEGGWKADLLGEYGFGPLWRDHMPHASFLDKHLTDYAWTVGARGGYVGYGWTVAGHLMYSYVNSESFNWSEDDFSMHIWRAGVDGQLLLDYNWNLVAGLEYMGFSDDEAHNAGSWTGTLGVNYNINPSAFVGAYVDVTMDHWKGDAEKADAEKGWGFKDGFGFGMKFGIDF